MVRLSLSITKALSELFPNTYLSQIFRPSRTGFPRNRCKGETGPTGRAVHASDTSETPAEVGDGMYV